MPNPAEFGSVRQRPGGVGWRVTASATRLLGDSPALAAVRARVARLLQRRLGAATRLPPILIQGETGTGKGLLAGDIHRAGPRAAEPFVDLNCAAIPETLLEAELFGFERGAFTDARQAKAGLFQTAHRGTLFLDEVGLLPEGAQGKLLKVLEERAVRRLGSTRSEPADVWLIAATSENLDAAVAPSADHPAHAAGPDGPEVKVGPKTSPSALRSSYPLLELLDDRHGTRSTIITSQLPIAQWHDFIGDPTLADSICDRLLHTAHRLVLKGPSRRKGGRARADRPASLRSDRDDRSRCSRWSDLGVHDGRNTHPGSSSPPTPPNENYDWGRLAGQHRGFRQVLQGVAGH